MNDVIILNVKREREMHNQKQR